MNHMGKVFAGGNKPIVPAFKFLENVVRPHDVVLAGFYKVGLHNLENVATVITRIVFQREIIAFMTTF